MEIRYHLDESVAHALANGLRRRGIDASTATDAKLIGASDEEQLSHALREGRIAVSHDDDFLRLASAGIPHAGIAYCRQNKLSIGQLVNALTDLWRTRTAEEMQGDVVYL